MLVTQVPAFRRFWYPVAFVEDVAAGPIARRVLGEDLVVWSTGPDEVAAARDKCPHRSSKLSIGWAEDGCVVCPYHGWRFGADGRATHIPQLDPGLPIPPKAQLRSVHACVRYGVVWVALEDPVGGIPALPEAGDPTYRYVRQFDEVWAAAATRLVDNSFDPAHVAYVHRGTFGNPSSAHIEVPEVSMTDEGLLARIELEVDNHLDVARRANGETTTRTVRTTVSRFVAPFLRVMSITYPNGLHHLLVTGICPVDDGHLRLVQWALRNDTEADVPAADVVAFDRAVTLEDQHLLEHTDPDYELDLTDLVHVKVDRGTIALRKIYRQFVEGTWPALARVSEAPGVDLRRGAASAEVPVVDIAPFFDGTPDDRAAVAAAMVDACATIGFVLVSGHGVDQAKLDDFYATAKEFFQLPLAEKLAVRSPANNLFQGYACPGDGPGFHTSERQSFNVSRFDTPAEAIAAGYPDDIGSHLYDALWPTRPAGFRGAWRAYFEEMETLTDKLLRIFEAGLGLADGWFADKVDKDPSTLVANYYSNDIESGHEPSPFRFKAHVDGDVFTILYQDDGPGSLQLHHRGLGWRNVEPVPGTFVVNIGELLARWTNDRLRATPHRVLAPVDPAEQALPRVSAPFFVKPNLDARIGPIPELLAPGEQPRYPTITSRQWLGGYLADIDAGYDSTEKFAELTKADPALR